MRVLLCMDAGTMYMLCGLQYMSLVYVCRTCCSTSREWLQCRQTQPRYGLMYISTAAIYKVSGNPGLFHQSDLLLISILLININLVRLWSKSASSYPVISKALQSMNCSRVFTCKYSTNQRSVNACLSFPAERSRTLCKALTTWPLLDHEPFWIACPFSLGFRSIRDMFIEALSSVDRR